MSDITKHKWSYSKNGCETCFEDELWLSTEKEHLAVQIRKDDAIAIAKHFGLISNEQGDWMGLSPKERAKHFTMR